MLPALKKLCKKISINSDCICCSEDIKIEDIENIRNQLNELIETLKVKREESNKEDKNNK